MSLVISNYQTIIDYVGFHWQIFYQDIELIFVQSMPLKLNFKILYQLVHIISCCRQIKMSCTNTCTTYIHVLLAAIKSCFHYNRYYQSCTKKVFLQFLF